MLHNIDLVLKLLNSINKFDCIRRANENLRFMKGFKRRLVCVSNNKIAFTDIKRFKIIINYFDADITHSFGILALRQSVHLTDQIIIILQLHATVSFI